MSSHNLSTRWAHHSFDSASYFCLLATIILVMFWTNCVKLELRWSPLPITKTGVSALLFIGFSLVRTRTLHCMYLFFSLFSRQPLAELRCALCVPYLAQIRVLLLLRVLMVSSHIAVRIPNLAIISRSDWWHLRTLCGRNRLGETCIVLSFCS